MLVNEITQEVITEPDREKLLTYRTIRNSLHILMHTPRLRELFIETMQMRDRVLENRDLSRSIYHMLNAMIGDPPDNSFDTTINHLKQCPELYNSV